MLNFLKVLFWGNLLSQSLIVLLFWCLAAAGYYEYNQPSNKDEFSPIIIMTMVISFILSIILYSKARKNEQENQSIEQAIYKGISRAKSPVAHDLSEVIAIAFLTIGMTFIFAIILPYFMYIAPTYSIYVLGVQFYKKKKSIPVQN
ncbi:MAG: hypothetical protein AB7U26_02430 [Sulfuricurvum sp.]